MEQEHPECTSLEQLYDLLKVREPDQTELVLLEENPIHAEWNPGEMTPHLERCKQSNLRFKDMETFLSLKALDWNQVFNWSGEEPPVQTEGNKGWKWKLEERMKKIDELRLHGVVKGPTDVAAKRNDGLEDHSVQRIMRDAQAGVVRSCVDVAAVPKSGEQAVPAGSGASWAAEGPEAPVGVPLAPVRPSVTWGPPQFSRPEPPPGPPPVSAWAWE